MIFFLQECRNEGHETNPRTQIKSGPNFLNKDKMQESHAGDQSLHYHDHIELVFYSRIFQTLGVNCKLTNFATNISQQVLLVFHMGLHRQKIIQAQH